MASAFNKEIRRSIRQTLGRFVAIAVIAALGAGFYAGLRMSAPDMKIAADQNYDGTNLMDIRVMSTLGLSDAEIDTLRSVEGVEAVMPAYEVDAVSEIDGSQYVVRIHSLDVDAAKASDVSDGMTAVSDDADYINRLFTDFFECHGDRLCREDPSILGGVALYQGRPVTVLVHRKGKNLNENIACNFGMPSPEGYRKALRLMKQAETFNRPVVCFVDTPGAFCGLEAEERGQGEAIARNLFEISDLKVPVLSIVIGEGGSGGALAMAVADEVWMLENAIYSILSPEGFASILYKDSKKAPDAAKVMKVTAKDLLQLELIERIVPEEEPACTDNLYRLAEYMDSAMAEFFKTYLAMSDEELREHRYQRFRRM